MKIASLSITASSFIIVHGESMYEEFRVTLTNKFKMFKLSVFNLPILVMYM